MKYNSNSYIGIKSGYLTVIGYDSGNFVCRCECGKTLKANPWMVVHLKKKSCSSKECEYFHKLQKDASTSHGLTGNRLYTIWNNMVARCYHSQNPNYKNYGMRGISMCTDWRDDVQNFIKWAKNNGYTDDLTIDRIDVNGNYEPSNCRWVGYKEQIENRRPYEKQPRKATKHIWEINGECKSGVEWCKIYGISFPTVMYRMNTLGLSPQEALTMKKKQEGRPRKGE